jgi:His/Glu/Gln/Arg/opine family amino acid ABC transporter permease subunit
MSFDVQGFLAAFPVLAKGALVTVEVSVLAVCLGLAVGLGLLLIRQTRVRVLHYLVAVYISLMRGTPLFVQILTVYYALPAIGLNLPRFQAGVIALSLNSGAYVTEIIRGGLTAIPRGQVEAARALGMGGLLIWRRIVLPQVFALILPPLTVEFTALLKGSALLSIIAVVELTRKAQQVIAVTYRPVETWIAVALLYFAMCFVLGDVTRRMEKRAAAYRT